MESCIEVYNGHGCAEEQAKAIAKHYSTTYEKMDDGICLVKCNKELERAFTYDEETFEAACEEVAQCTGVAICVDDIDF